MSPFVGLFYIVLFVQIWLCSAFLITHKALPRFDLFASAIGVIFVIGLLAYFSAIKITLSQSLLFQSYSILITIILTALYLGESKYFDITTSSGIKVLMGTLLAFVALWYLLHTGSKKEEKVERIWFLYILVTIIALGVGSFLSISTLKYLMPMETLINQGNLMIPTLFIIATAKKEKLIVSRSKLFLTAANSVFSTVAVIAFYYALQIVPVAKFYPIQQVSLVIITIITGYIFFNERNIFSGKRLLGMGLGLIGIILLVTS